MRNNSGRFGLEGKTALVTGASRGIGRAIALGLAEAGADVAVLARSTGALAEGAKEIEAMGRRAFAYTCDVDDAEQIRRTVAAAIADLGHLDVVVNNAGGFEHVGPFLAMTADDWTKILRTNLDSVVHVCRAAGEHMTARGTGSLINVASVGGYNGVPMLSPYAVAKAGVISLTRTLAVEWGAAGVRVNAIAPGWTRTQLTSAFAGNPELADGLIQAVPLGVWGEPDDLAGAAVYLAGDAARMVTGLSLTVDGGVTAYNTGPAMLDLLQAGRIPV
ncbi:2-deoxy-D-gluconate 3-dehydrogenase [Catellatospora sp. TT07R-123]|uniref:SDR family NAD(P)-dependent oxidoreductase n=1 Tax=Catellatospora sp. TT07R-123 TaxID=2733863 RepID=UPI001AFF9BD3|nr:glucose 1-dehydrogenase [Catellatospora sp. TT07R-123]GHJ43042.1 2-deoxy-D-gluconate 3-dehydrogenase [Catellatospora sp. TT07R-123]